MYITGAGFAAGESVQCQVLHIDATITDKGWLKNPQPQMGEKPGRFDLLRIRPLGPRLVASAIKGQLRDLHLIPRCIHIRGPRRLANRIQTILG